MKFGYKRPLINDEDVKLQLVDIKHAEVYIEQHPYMKKRHELEDLVMQALKGRSIVCTKFCSACGFSYYNSKIY